MIKRLDVYWPDDTEEPEQAGGDRAGLKLELGRQPLVPRPASPLPVVKTPEYFPSRGGRRVRHWLCAVLYCSRAAG